MSRENGDAVKRKMQDLDFLNGEIRPRKFRPILCVCLCVCVKMRFAEPYDVLQRDSRGFRLFHVITFLLCVNCQKQNMLLIIVIYLCVYYFLFACVVHDSAQVGWKHGQVELCSLLCRPWRKDGQRMPMSFVLCFAGHGRKTSRECP